MKQLIFLTCVFVCLTSMAQTVVNTGGSRHLFPPSTNVSIAQTKSCASTTSPNVCAFTSNITAGNVLVVDIDGSGQSSTPTPTISDSAGNYWIIGSNTSGSSFARMTTYFVQSVASTGADTITVTLTGTLYHVNVYMTEYSNASSIDTYAATNAANTNPLTDSVVVGNSGSWIESWIYEEYGTGTLALSNSNFVWRSGTGNGVGPVSQPSGLFDYQNASSGTISNTYTFTLTGTGAFRSMPNTMTSIGAKSTVAVAPNLVPESANLVGWWAADCYTFSGGCTTPSPGTISSAWHDQSTLANDLAFHGTCTFVASAVGGKPAVTLDGTSCYLDNSTANIAATNGRTLIAVYAIGATTPGGRFFSGKSNNSWSLAPTCASSGSGAPAAILEEGIAFKVVPSGPVCDTSYHIIVGQTQNTPFLAEIKVDRSIKSLSTYTPYVWSVTDHPAIGWTSPQFFKGSVAEVIYFNTNISQKSVQQIENYLHNKYGI